MSGNNLLALFGVGLSPAVRKAVDAINRQNRRISARATGTKFALVELVMQLHEEGSINAAVYAERLLGEADQVDPLIGDTLRHLGEGIGTASRCLQPTFTVVEGKARWKAVGGGPIQAPSPPEPVTDRDWRRRASW